MRTAASEIPKGGGVKALREAAATCTSCPLYANATQTVFGLGPARAELMVIGEQPGDREDIEGKPFVGPAGHLLDHALIQAGIDPGDAYLTNVVKHFKFKPKGKRRIHQTPGKLEIEACQPWLEAELERVKPDVVAILGAVAGKALLGPSFKVTAERGKVLEPDFAPRAVATIHPSAILRAGERRGEEYAAFVDDLRVVAALTESL
jgi:uracil-DNA glycosylase family protein